MAETVAQMTPAELQAMIENVIEEKFVELLGDPDEGLEVREELIEQLRQQQQRVAAGDRGRPMSEIVKELGWDQ